MRILFEGQTLLSFKLTIVALIAFCVFVIFGPLLMFSPHLARAKRGGLRQYGTLATEYVSEFEKKWIDKGEHCESLLGSGDIQSLADLANSYAVVREMKFAPFVLEDVTRLVIATALPLLPLVLTIMPAEELVTRLIKVLSDVL